MLERLSYSDEIMGLNTFDKINAAIDEVNKMRMDYGDYGSKEERPLTMPDTERAPVADISGTPDLTHVDWNGNNDPTLDKTLVRPMDRITSEPITLRQQGGMSEAEQRKAHPMASGVLDYFPDALYEVAGVSKKGNDQHNPGQPLHWDKGKSTDHADSLLRHLKDRGKRDTDGERHSAKVAWRALALLQTEIENEKKAIGNEGQTAA